MHGDRRIAQHRFGTRRGDDHMGRLARFGIDDGVHEMPEMSLPRLRVNFVIADRRLQMRVPVDQPFVAVDQ